MDLQAILILAGANLIASLFLKGRGREWYLYILSAGAVFVLQPELPVRGLDFWLPLLTLGIVLLGWTLSAQPGALLLKENWISAGCLMALVCLLASMRYWGLDAAWVKIQPPPFEQVVIVLLLFGGLLLAISRVKHPQIIAWGGIALLVGLLIVLKTPFLSYQASLLLRTLAAQGTAHASALDIRWLGFSYIAFRLIHTFRDRQAGRLPDVTLKEYVTYSVFYPALAAGPIDRIERFIKDLRTPIGAAPEDWMEGGKRLAIGMFKKFVLADGLAIFALNAVNSAQVHSAGWAWWMLYAYALQIYLDFSGYTDVAIGLARLSGIRLPENFKTPYWTSSLTTFWNNWHMTLTQWFRGYFFNPMVRAMRRSKQRIAPVMVLLISQLSLMILIGLWHGVSWNFVLWGLWHGLGLFAQNRWSDWIGPRLAFLEDRPGLRRAFALAGGVLTFHYVALGWVWFVLPEPGQALRFFQTLAGG